ncbi:MAG: 3-methyl-2-oxobutanoate hydroxymethyltransferase [Myxococcota bacterium]|jgi:3-methyl-2-oxobutanoate hydroxymethyltransferase|nr:3-methyl-2-oxobutanoate hydroxymethyltransferase [Myxococcota bacterium]
MAQRINIWTVQQRKQQAQPVVMVTAYDASFARLVDELVDVILVGDSLGNVIQGHETTLPVSLEEMEYHVRCVARGSRRALIVGDLPFGSYQSSVELGMLSSERLMRAGAHAVKLEGGAHQAELVTKLVANGIPVMGHLGLTPQSVHALGGYRVQGRTEASAAQIRRDALLLQQAGVFSLVLECVRSDVAKEVSASLDVPTIGIGAGPDCDGQVLVLHDMLGLSQPPHPKFVKVFEDLGERTKSAMQQYAEEVRTRRFPASEHSFD